MSKRTAAFDANNREPAADKISVDEEQGLAAVAAQLAALEGLFSLTVSAGIAARDKAGLEDWKETTPQRIAADEARELFENVNRRAHDITRRHVVRHAPGYPWYSRSEPLPAAPLRQPSQQPPRMSEDSCRPPDPSRRFSAS